MAYDGLCFLFRNLACKQEIENIQELDGDAANTSDRQFANVSDETASDLDEVQVGQQ